MSEFSVLVNKMNERIYRLETQFVDIQSTQQRQRLQALDPMMQEQANKLALINQLKSELNQNMAGLSGPTQNILMNSMSGYGANQNLVNSMLSPQSSVVDLSGGGANQNVNTNYQQILRRLQAQQTGDFSAGSTSQLNADHP